MSQEKPYEEMVRKLLAEKCEGWRQDEIEKKFNSVMEHFRLDLELQALDKQEKQVADDIKAEEAEIDVSIDLFL
jgi:hypothetical protein